MLLSPIELTVGVIAVLRLAELVLARRNARRLLAGGGVEHGARHYPLFVLLHVGWLAALLIAVPGDRVPHWLPLGLFGGLQLARAWVITSLGRYWTTRVITVPGAPLVTAGPYRWLRHPNYVIVTAEIALVPLAFGAWQVALLFSALNAALLAWRIHVENAALAGRRAQAS